MGSGKANGTFFIGQNKFLSFPTKQFYQFLIQDDVDNEKKSYYKNYFIIVIKITFSHNSKILY